MGVPTVVDRPIPSTTALRDPLLGPEDIEFSAVMIVDSRTGKILDMSVSSPLAGVGDPDALAKLASLMVSAARSVAAKAGSPRILELDLVLEDRIVIVIDDGDVIRIGLT